LAAILTFSRLLDYMYANPIAARNRYAYPMYCSSTLHPRSR